MSRSVKKGPYVEPKLLKRVEELNEKGKLVKNLPYTLENTGMSVNNRQIQRPVVDYTLPSGSIIKLYGDPRHDNKSFDADGYVDLVIDESNPENYFILSGLSSRNFFQSDFPPTPANGFDI